MLHTLYVSHVTVHSSVMSQRFPSTLHYNYTPTRRPDKLLAIRVMKSKMAIPCLGRIYQHVHSSCCRHDASTTEAFRKHMTLEANGVRLRRPCTTLHLATSCNNTQIQTTMRHDDCLSHYVGLRPEWEVCHTGMRNIKRLRSE